MLVKGISEHKSGRLDQAEAIYKQVLEQDSNHSQALHLYGVVMYQRGLSQAALNYIDKAISIDDSKAEFFNSKGLALLELNHDDEALAAFKHALTLHPDGVEISLNMANTLAQLGRYNEAIDRYRAIIKQHPGHERAFCNLGNLYLETGDYTAAEDSFRAVLEINPGLIEQRVLLGNALYEQAKYSEALVMLEEALEQSPANPEVLNDIGNCYLELNQHEKAIEHYQEAVKIKPDYAAVLKNIGVTCQELGNNEKAAESYLKALETEPDDAEIYHYLSVINTRYCAVEDIQELLNFESQSDKDRMHCYFALGNIYSNAKDYAQAFKNYKRANEIKRKSIIYDSVKNSDYIDSIINAYNSELFSQFTGAEVKTRLPVFIVGMPRSGTTLVEQILSSHSHVHGAGELTVLASTELKLESALADQGGYPNAVKHLHQGLLKELAEDYLSRLPKTASDISRITDKLPGNFLRIGLIKLLFPDAGIIHCVRDPLDTCLSIYTNYFADGYKYGYELEELGKYYMDYERLMRHWNSLFADSIYQVQYENLIAEQESVSQEMIRHLGLEWEPRCLDFYKNKRAVKTASNVQVRKPLYQQSVNKWKCYAEELQPLIRIFESGLHGFSAEK